MDGQAHHSTIYNSVDSYQATTRIEKNMFEEDGIYVHV